MLPARIVKYNIIFDLVTVNDAEFIVMLRSGERNKYISDTAPDVDRQKEWIETYKNRERENKEYYFIVRDLSGKPYGTTRLYNFDGQKFEVGSWVFLKDSPTGMAVKADIATRELAFEEMNFNVCTFEVRKDNKSVLRYHRGFKPLVIGEDDLNFYFELSKDRFYDHRNRLIKLI